MKKTGILFLLLAIVAMSCQREEITPDEAQAGAKLYAACPNLQKTSPLDIDPYTIQSASLNGDCIEIDLQFSGGCKRHPLELTWDGLYLESFPPQVRLQPHHENNNDLCEALITKTLRRDISVIQDPYYSTIIVNVLNPNGTVGAQVTYNY